MSTPAVTPPPIDFHLVDSNQMIPMVRIHDPVRMQRINTNGTLFSGYQVPGVAIDGNPLQLTNIVPKEVADRYFRSQPLLWRIVPVDESGMPVDRELCIKYLAWLDERYPGHNFAELYADYLRATDPDAPLAERPQLKEPEPQEQVTFQQLPQQPRHRRKPVGEAA